MFQLYIIYVIIYTVSDSNSHSYVNQLNSCLILLQFLSEEIIGRGKEKVPNKLYLVSCFTS